MRTKFALAFYYVAIGALVVTAGGIVWKLIIFPPCTPTGNTCVVDPGTVTGLASSVLGVAATVLAILGAVAVAAWWTSLDDRVTTHVNKLYEDYKAEISKQLSDFLAEQQREVSTQLSTVQTNLQTVESRIGTAGADIDHLEQITRDIEEIAVDGLLLMRPARELEEWAKRAITNHRFPIIAFKMAAHYIADLEDSLPQAEDDLMKDKAYVSESFQRFNKVATSVTDIDLSVLRSICGDLHMWLDSSASGEDLMALTLINWEGVLRWRTIAEHEKVSAESLLGINEKIGAYESRIDLLKAGRDQLKEQTQLFLDRADRYLRHQTPEEVANTSDPTAPS